MQICEKSKEDKKIRTLKEKYAPQTFEDLCIPDDIIQDVKMYIASNDPLRIIFHGNIDTGKSTIARIMLRYLYESQEEKNKYSLIISGLEQLYIRTDIQQKLNSFCRFQFNQTSFKKTLIIDDMDVLNNHNQHIIKDLMEKYTHIHYIFICMNKHYVIPSIVKRLNCIQTRIYDTEKMCNLSNQMANELKLNIVRTDIPYIVKKCKSSLCLLFLYFEKMRYMKPEYRMDYIISENILHQFTNAWKSKNLKDCVNILEDIEFKGYYAIDFLHLYYEYILECEIHETLRLKVIQYIGLYIANFYSIHSEFIELYFFVYDLISCINIA
jgi:replication-associated recombination protein RarA